MIDGLADLLELTGQPALPELRACIGELFGGDRAAGRVIGVQHLNRSGTVTRVRFEVHGEPVSVVAKCSRADPAQRNTLVARRWLPAVGLESGAPAILATGAQRSGRCVWQVYEDLGEVTLETDRHPTAVRAAVRLVGELHTRFSGHPLLAEVRERGAEFGASFYSSSVSDAIRCLEALAHANPTGLADCTALTDQLLARLWLLRAQEPERTEAIADLGGPETLLHGDMWLENITIARNGDPVSAALIDWDHAGLGPLGYDLSTFVDRFACEERQHVLELYEEAVADTGWRLPCPKDVDYLFATFELARIANCVIWSALAAADGLEGAPEKLAMANDWFSALDVGLHAP